MRTKSALKPLSDIEAAIESCDMVTFARFIIYGNHYYPPPCATPDPDPHPTDAIVIGQND